MTGPHLRGVSGSSTRRIRTAPDKAGAGDGGSPLPGPENGQIPMFGRPPEAGFGRCRAKNASPAPTPPKEPDLDRGTDRPLPQRLRRTLLTRPVPRRTPATSTRSPAPAKAAPCRPALTASRSLPSRLAQTAGRELPSKGAAPASNQRTGTPCCWTQRQPPSTYARISRGRSTPPWAERTAGSSRRRDCSTRTPSGSLQPRSPVPRGRAVPGSRPAAGTARSHAKARGIRQPRLLLPKCDPNGRRHCQGLPWALRRLVLHVFDRALAAR